jgi:ketosteroid isomerase-like protein
MPAAFAAAFNARDVERLLSLYAENAVLLPDGSTEVPAPGIRAVLEQFLAIPGEMSMSLKRAVVGGREAVVIAEWKLGDSMSGTTSDVVSLGADGKWRYVIDAPFGIKA